MHSQHSLNARLLRFRSQPHSEDAYALAEDLIDAGRYADARNVVALAKPQDREDAALLLLEARAHLLERDLIRAQAALLEAVKVAPSLQAAYRYLGEVLLKRGDPLRAQKTLRRALALRADDAEARALLERAEYLAEAANDSLEALPSDLHSDFEADAAQRGVELGSEPPAPDAAVDDEAQPRTRTAPDFTAAPVFDEAAARSGREDEPTSEFQHASHVDPSYSVTASDRRRAQREAAERPLPPTAAGAGLAGAAWDAALSAPLEASRPRTVRTDPLPPLRAADGDGSPTAGRARRAGAEPPLPAAGAREDEVPRVRGAGAEPPLRAARVRVAEADAAERGENVDVGARRAAVPPPGGRLRGRGDLAASSSGAAERARLGQAVAENELPSDRTRAAGRPLPPPPRRARRTPETDEAGAPAARERASDGSETMAARGRPGRTSEPGGAVDQRAASSPQAEPRRAAEPGPGLSSLFDEGSELGGSEELDPALGRSSQPAAEQPANVGRSSRRDHGRTEDAGRAAPEASQRAVRGKRLSDFRMPPRSASTEPPALPDKRAALQPTAADVSEPTSVAADGGGASVHGPQDPEQVLAVMRQLGLFEDPSAQPAVWAERSAVETRGQRVRGALIWLWSATLVLSVAAYFGWNAFVDRRHATAARLVEQAHALTFVGDHAALVDAERMLRLAREQHPASLVVSEEALFVQIERVLEDGERDTASLRSAFVRASAAKISGTSVALANLLLSAPGADATGREHALAEVLGFAKGDARTLYLVGRAEERMGVDAAGAHFEAAARAEPKLIPAQLALAERAYEHGERASAMRSLDAAVSSAPSQLRVRLFRLLVSADDIPPEKLRLDMNALAEPLRKGNSIDKALGALVRARLARRSAEPKAALAALDAAAQSGADDARVLGWLAEEALALGNSALAQQLASRALTLAPDNVRSRRLLARVLIERGAGRQAFVLLASLPNADAEVQVWRAKAALLTNDPELLRAALYTLPQASGKKPEPDVQKAALRVRIETRLDADKAVLDRARALVHAAPTDPDALLALAEAALALHDAKSAQSALKQRALLLPDDVQAQTLLGRSLRMGGDVEGAEAAFRRALSLRPGYVDAQTALASLLLDRGQYAEADAQYRELALRDETALSGRLGRVEALIGDNKLADAQVQLEAAPEAERTSAAYREGAAKLALARGELAPALRLLGPLSEEQPKRAQVRALYADALLMAAQLSAAADEADAALGLDPELPEALLCRAELQLLAKKTKDALSTLDKAELALRERVRPPAQKARRLTLLGRTLLQRKKRGDADAAVRVLREATTQPGAAADSYFYLADALSGSKDKAGAQEAARRYLELAPNGPYRQRAQRMLGAAR